MSNPVIPGQTNPSRTTKRYEDWLRELVKKRKVARLQQSRDELEAIVEDLAETGPAYTGASAGRADRQVVPLDSQKSHPANKLGLSIGNVLNGGESGWQIGETARTKGSTVRLYIYNPMWDYYLALVEAARASHQTSPGGFVRDAWAKHLARRR